MVQQQSLGLILNDHFMYVFAVHIKKSRLATALFTALHLVLYAYG